MYLIGASVIEYIKDSIQLMSMKYEIENVQVNLKNIALSIEQCAIGSYSYGLCR